MAYVNVADWKTDQVTDWLKGLDNVIAPYLQSFLNNHVTGQQLLSFRPDDLEHLGIAKIGHQEIILEGVEHLRNIHYELDRENLQFLAMRLSCQAHSLHSELCHSHIDTQRLSTQILADIANIVTAVKPLIAWLDRPGFSGEMEYKTKRCEILSLALRMATCGQRDRFAETPVTDMKDASAKLAKIADTIVQEITDPLILQPASLDLATIKKRSSDDLGFYIVPSFRGIHQISDLKLNSPAHQSGKIEPGDEIVQINYQTVVGWDVKHVMSLFAECPTEVLLTLKKRPRHTKVYGQIYVKPYRLPSKKRAVHSHFARRPELLTHLPLRFSIQKVAIPIAKKTENKEDSRGSSSSDEEVGVQHNLVVPSKPVHRRATITGASPLSKRPPLDIHELWHDLKLEKDSHIKQSSTSVIDFEERVSSSVTKSTQSLQICESPKKEGEKEQAPTETLSIKQKIELFSKDEKQEKPKVPVHIVKPQIRINSEPLLDDVAIGEAIKLAKEKPDNILPDSERLQLSQNSFLPSNSVLCSSLSNNNKEKMNLLETDGTDCQPNLPRIESEEHGKVVETINKHLLSNSFGDDFDLSPFDPEAIKIGKMLETLSNSLPHSGRSRKGIVIGEGHGALSTHSLPIRKGPHSKEFHSELSRTIAQVYKEESPFKKGENLCFLDQQKCHIDNQQIHLCHPHNSPPAQPKTPNRDDLYRSYGAANRSEAIRIEDEAHVQRVFIPPKEKNLKTCSIRDNLSETSSCRSYGSSVDYAEHYGPTHFLIEASTRKKAQGERQTLPKAAPRVLTSDQSNSSEIASPPVPPPRPSLSKPPGACYRAIMAARSIGRGSPKTQRKKNLISSKGRNVNVKDFSSIDCEGWLLQRCRKGSGTWKKRWCLVHSNFLYTFINKEAKKAETLVSLPGFTVAQANEVKSRPFAFKVYHTGTTFYFAAETHFELSVWLDALITSTLVQNSHSQGITFSESEGEDNAREEVTRKPPVPPTPVPRAPPPPPTPIPSVPTSHQANPPSESSKKFGSLKKLGCRGSSSGSSLDRKYLRLLGTGPVPVPTAQFRSYRRVHNTTTTPTPNNTSTTGHTSGDQHQQHPLPPEMADYRLASLTTKSSTPPVPRRRILGSGNRGNEVPQGRPHISAPIFHPDQIIGTGFERCRHPPPLDPNIPDYRDGSAERFWLDSLRRSDTSQKKNKKSGCSNMSQNKKNYNCTLIIPSGIILQ